MTTIARSASASTAEPVALVAALEDLVLALVLALVLVLVLALVLALNQGLVLIQVPPRQALAEAARPTARARPTAALPLDPDLARLRDQRDQQPTCTTRMITRARRL